MTTAVATTTALTMLERLTTLHPLGALACGGWGSLAEGG